MAQDFDSGQQTGRAHWQEASAELFVALEPTAEDPQAIRMHVQRSMPGQVMCAVNDSLPPRLFPSSSLIARGSEDYIGVLLVEAGATVVVQDEREARAESGDFLLFDTFRRYQLQNTLGSEQIVFQVPREMILDRIGQVGDYTATCFSREQPVHRITFDFLKTLAQNAAHLNQELAQHLMMQGLDLLALSLYELPHSQLLKPSTHRATLLFRVKAFIKANLDDSQLSLEKVGGQLGLTSRYVNSLLADEQTSFRHYLLGCRLDRCKQDLSGQMHAHRRVGEIAYAWGFNDLAYFSRAFKARFGTSPRNWRAGVASDRLNK